MKRAPDGVAYYHHDVLGTQFERPIGFDMSTGGGNSKYSVPWVQGYTMALRALDAAAHLTLCLEMPLFLLHTERVTYPTICCLLLLLLPKPLLWLFNHPRCWDCVACVHSCPRYDAIGAPDPKQSSATIEENFVVAKVSKRRRSSKHCEQQQCAQNARGRR